jgi:hypothetical protein
MPGWSNSLVWNIDKSRACLGMTMEGSQVWPATRAANEYKKTETERTSCITSS